MNKGNTNSPTRPPRQKHHSSPSPILKNSPNRQPTTQQQKFHAINTPLLTTTRQSPDLTFRRNYSLSNSPKLDRSAYDYYYEYNRSPTRLNRSTGSSDLDTSSRSSPFSRQSSNLTPTSLRSPSLVNFHYVRPSRSSTPKYQLTQRSLSSGSKHQPRIHHIKIEIEPDSLDFKRNLKKACSEDAKESDKKEKTFLKLGDFVYVDSSKGLLSGKLRYLGPTDFKEGHWCGIELDLPYGEIFNFDEITFII